MSGCECSKCTGGGFTSAQIRETLSLMSKEAIADRTQKDASDMEIIRQNTTEVDDFGAVDHDLQQKSLHQVVGVVVQVCTAVAKLGEAFRLIDEAAATYARVANSKPKGNTSPAAGNLRWHWMQVHFNLLARWHEYRMRRALAKQIRTYRVWRDAAANRKAVYAEATEFFNPNKNLGG